MCHLLNSPSSLKANPSQSCDLLNDFIPRISFRFLRYIKPVNTFLTFLTLFHRFHQYSYWFYSQRCHSCHSCHHVSDGPLKLSDCHISGGALTGSQLEQKYAHWRVQPSSAVMAASASAAHYGADGLRRNPTWIKHVQPGKTGQWIPHGDLFETVPVAG